MKRNKRIILICPICSKEFFTHPYRLKNTKVVCCSNDCKFKLIQRNSTITRKCVICDKEFSFVKSNNKGKRPNIYCSHECMYKGKITTKITFYRKIAFESLPHYCHFCNSKDTLQVHHKDHNRSNNEISNLVILCTSCHIKLHKFYYIPSFAL